MLDLLAVQEQPLPRRDVHAVIVDNFASILQYVCAFAFRSENIARMHKVRGRCCTSF